MNKVKNLRDYKIDILRFIAIVCIILAHTTNLPITIRIFRNFDVTLMVMIMGTSYYLSSNGKDINYLTYIKKRFNRLITSTWKFLTIFL